MVAVMLFVFSVFIVALGNAHQDSESLCYDLDFSELYATGEEENTVSTTHVEVSGAATPSNRKPRQPEDETKEFYDSCEV